VFKAVTEPKVFVSCHPLVSVKETTLKAAALERLKLLHLFERREVGEHKWKVKQLLNVSATRFIYLIGNRRIHSYELSMPFFSLFAHTNSLNNLLVEISTCSVWSGTGGFLVLLHFQGNFNPCGENCYCNPVFLSNPRPHDPLGCNVLRKHPK